MGVETAEELRETRMEDREEIETKWRKEFDELGEEGVREKLFRGTIQIDQRKEGFAYRWLGEKRKAQEKTNKKRWKNIRIALKIFVVIVIAGAIFLSWFRGWLLFLS